jgi:hypothetical protein
MHEKDQPPLDASHARDPISPIAAPARGRRYPIRITLRYRTDAEPQWQEGRTVNISRTGVLFNANNPLEVRTTVQMTLMLPAEIAGDEAAEVFCLGRIVRTIPPGAPDESTLLAATISGYLFDRK